MTGPLTRQIPASTQYPGLYAYRTHGTADAPDRREIVAVGEGAEEAVMAEVERREARDGAR